MMTHEKTWNNVKNIICIWQKNNTIQNHPEISYIPHPLAFLITDCHAFKMYTKGGTILQARL